MVLGRGHGLGSVLRALRELGAELTVVVAVAEDVGAGAAEPEPETDPALSELRRSLEALSGDQVALARALRRPLMIDRLGRHPLGNLLLQSLASAFGDLGAASTWLAAQLGISGSVLPATAEPLKFEVESGCAGPEDTVSRLRLIPEHPHVAPPVISAIRAADLVLLAPGSLYRSVLVACAIPDIREALRVTEARVLWICNLESVQGGSENEEFAALRRHGVRIDAVLYDPMAGIRLDAERLRDQGVETIPRRLGASTRGSHDTQLLRSALAQLVAARQPQG